MSADEIESASLSMTMSQEIKMESPSEVDMPFVLKRKRGRPPKSSYTGPKQWLPDSQLSNDAEEQSETDTEIICIRCKKQMKNVITIRQHFMTEHSLMWAREYPQGYEDPYGITKKMGHIDCQKCKKRFRFAQYYKHHQVWCGKEDEVEVCEVCKHSLKAMWMQQHLTSHRAQDKRMIDSELNSKMKQEEQRQQDENADGEEGQSAGQRSKRKAAKNAIKLLASLQDTTGQEHRSADDDDCYSEGNSDDTDEDSEEESEDKDSLEVKKKPKTSKTKVERPDKQIHSITNGSTSEENMWIKVCGNDIYYSSKDRLQLTQDFYTSWSEGRAFPDLIPRSTDWEPLAAREKEKYMPVNKESVMFTYSTRKNTDAKDEQHSLKFGHSISDNGKSYLYAGGPLWAFEWCPIPNGSDHEQVLAISADRTTDEPPDTVTIADGPGLIQIWSVGTLENKIKCCAQPVFRYAIAHDSGYIRSISWCRKACFDMGVVDRGYLKRLGLLAVGCSDGRVLIYCPAQPDELQHRIKSAGTRNVFRPKPALVLVPNSMKGCGPCLNVSWQQGGDFKYIIAGYGYGMVYLWDITTSSPLLKVDSSTLRPMRCFSFHTMAIVSTCWNPRNPSIFVTTSLDFSVCVWNVNTPDQPIGIIRKPHVHVVPRSVCWAGPLHNGFFSTCDKLTGYENTYVYFHGLSKSVLLSSSGNLIIQCHSACAWDVNFCPFYDVLVTCDAVGRVKVSLPPMRDVRCQVASKTTWHKGKIPYADLYHARLCKREPLTSIRQQPDTLKKPGKRRKAPSSKNCNQNVSSILEKVNHCDESQNNMNTTASVEQTTSITEQGTTELKSKRLGRRVNSNINIENHKNKQDIGTSESNDVTSGISQMDIVSVTGNKVNVDNDGDGPVSSQQGNRIDIHQTQEGSEEMLHFHNCQMAKSDIKFIKSKSEKPQLEVFGGNNLQAVHKVHLNPNPDSCLWLASGGQSGIVRLDNLSGLVLLGSRWKISAAMHEIHSTGKDPDVILKMVKSFGGILY